MKIQGKMFMMEIKPRNSTVISVDNHASFSLKAGSQSINSCSSHWINDLVDVVTRAQTILAGPGFIAEGDGFGVRVHGSEHDRMLASAKIEIAEIQKRLWALKELVKS